MGKPTFATYTLATPLFPPISVHLVSTRQCLGLILIWHWAVGRNGLGPFHPVAPRCPQVTFPHTCSVLTSNHTFCYSVLEPQQAWLAPPSSHVRSQVLDLQCEKGTCSGFTFVNEVPNLLCYLGYLIPENSHLKMMSWRPQHWPLLSLHLILEIENKARGETCLRTALSEGSQSYCKSFQGQTCKMGTSYPATIWGRRQGLVSGAGRVMRTNLQGTRKSPFPTSICHNL